MFEGVEIFNSVLHNDNRGMFREWAKLNSNQLPEGFNSVQLNIVQSKLNVLRGLHFNIGTQPLQKYITCAYGKIDDVIVDIDSASSNFGNFQIVELDSELGNSIFIPSGFAHGYLVKTDIAVVIYQVDQFYNPKSEVVLNPFDENLNIPWKIEEKPIISSRDANAPTLQELLIRGLI